MPAAPAPKINPLPVPVQRWFDRSKEFIFVFIFLGGLTWLAHFLQANHFGFYEDDYAVISPAMNQSWFFLIKELRQFSVWFSGKPIGWYLYSFFAFCGDKLGGLQGIYFLAFLSVLTNCLLFYRILRILDSRLFALLGAIGFCLFPADTTKSLLCHAFMLQNSLTFLLLAILCYLNHKKRWAYGLIFCTLLTYESTFPVFFAVPLLQRKWDRKLGLELVRHLCLLVALIGIVFVIRLLKSEPRVTTAANNLGDVVSKIIQSLWIGPLTSGSLFVTAPLQAISEWTGTIWLVASLSGLVLVGLLASRLSTTAGKPIKQKLLFALKHFQQSVLAPSQPQTRYRNLATWFINSDLRLLLLGLIFWSLGYVFSFTHYPPDAEAGRATSVHLAATFGGSFCFAYIVSRGFILLTLCRLRKLAIGLLALYLSVLLAYRFVIQNDYTLSWTYQQAFWSDIVKNASDITDDTIVFVSNKDLPQTKYIKVNSWADELVLQQIYQFPPEWKSQPKAYIVRNQWQNGANTRPEGGFGTPTLTWPGYVVVREQTRLIFLRKLKGQFQRIEGPIQLASGEKFILQSKQAATVDHFPQGVLFKYLIKSENS